jgi:hypothetical protein
MERGVQERREIAPGVLTETVLDGFCLAMMTSADRGMALSIGIVVLGKVRVGVAEPLELIRLSAPPRILHSRKGRPDAEAVRAGVHAFVAS